MRILWIAFNQSIEICNVLIDGYSLNSRNTRIGSVILMGIFVFNMLNFAHNTSFRIPFSIYISNSNLYTFVKCTIILTFGMQGYFSFCFDCGLFVDPYSFILSSNRFLFMIRLCFCLILFIASLLLCVLTPFGVFAVSL